MTEIKQIGGVRLQDFTNGLHFEFHDGARGRFYRFIFESGYKDNAKPDRQSDFEKFKQKYEVFDKNLSAEDSQFQGSKKSDITSLITEADKKRDCLYLGLKQAVSSFMLFPDEAKSKAAGELQKIFDAYKINTASQLDKETGLLKNFIQDIKTRCQAQLEVLSLEDFVTSMEKANNDVSSLLEKRDMENAGKTIGALKAARSKTDDAYRDLVRFLNALAIVDGDEEYSSFIDGENAVIARIKGL